MIKQVEYTDKRPKYSSHHDSVLSYFLVPPWVLSPLKDVSLLVTSKLNLTCEVKGDPTPSILWLKDESDVIPRAVLFQKNMTLAINSVEIADEGRYKCVLRNRAGNKTYEAYVEIKGILQAFSYLLFVFLRSGFLPLLKS